MLSTIEKKIGSDCVGALQFLVEGSKPPESGKLTKIGKSKVAEILRNLSSAPLGIDTQQDFRISIAGIQDKTSLHILDQEYYLPHGSTPSTHILKTPIQVKRGHPDMSDSVENEHFCLHLLRCFDISTPQTRIELFEDQKALVINRFDRHRTANWNLIRLPQEDLCQALGHYSNNKYQNQGGPAILDIMDLLKDSSESKSDRKIFFKVQVLMWLLGAIDGHAKNFSIFLKPAGRFQLTPVYDVMSIYPYLNSPEIRKNQIKLAMSFGKSKEYRLFKIQRRHIDQSAKQCQISKALLEEIFEEIKEQSKGLRDYAQTIKCVNEEMAQVILDEFESRLGTLFS